MGINLSNFLSSKSKNARMIDFQDLDHIDGLSISVVSANLYNDNRDDLSLFYFRDGANYASVYTQSKIVSENIKWNLNQKSKKIFSLLVNTRNANAFTGKQGYESLKKLSETISTELTKKQEQDEDSPKKISSKEIIFEYPLLKVESISSATFFLNSPNRSWPTLPMNGVSNQPPRPQEKPKDLVSVVGFLSSPPYI